MHKARVSAFEIERRVEFEDSTCDLCELAGRDHPSLATHRVQFESGLTTYLCDSHALGVVGLAAWLEKKLTYDRYLAFEVQKMLIASHPNAEYILVSCSGFSRTGLLMEVIENGKNVDVTDEVVRYLNLKLGQLSAAGPDTHGLEESVG